jgi:hypothetical protein
VTCPCRNASLCHTLSILSAIQHGLSNAPTESVNTTVRSWRTIDEWYETCVARTLNPGMRSSACQISADSPPDPNHPLHRIQQQLRGLRRTDSPTQDPELRRRHKCHLLGRGRAWRQACDTALDVALGELNTLTSLIRAMKAPMVSPRCGALKRPDRGSRAARRSHRGDWVFGSDLVRRRRFR